MSGTSAGCWPSTPRTTTCSGHTEPSSYVHPARIRLSPTQFTAGSDVDLVGAENAVTSCDLHVLVHETAEPVASEWLDSRAGGRGSVAGGRMLVK